MGKDYTVEELRNMLRGVTWGAFTGGDKVALSRPINGVSFYAKMGYHLNRPTLAVVVEGHFVALRYMPEETFRFTGAILDTCIDPDVPLKNDNRVYLPRLNGQWVDHLKEFGLFDELIIKD